MKFRISKVGPKGIQREYKMGPGWFEEVMGEDIIRNESAEGEAFLEIDVTGATVTVSGAVKGWFHVMCSRCLEPAKVVLDAELLLVLEEDKLGVGRELDEELELTEEDLNFATYTGDEIDLKPYIREQFLLAVPIAPLCKPDCWPESFDGIVEPGRRDGEAGQGSGGPEPDVRWKAELAKLRDSSGE